MALYITLQQCLRKTYCCSYKAEESLWKPSLQNKLSYPRPKWQPADFQDIVFFRNPMPPGLQNVAYMSSATAVAVPNILVNLDSGGAIGIGNAIGL